MKPLNDINTYYPSTNTSFELAMIISHNKASIFYKTLPPTYNLKSLKFDHEKPANFYILPKVHKPYNIFLKGRPISSTFKKSNKHVSKLLDKVLRPCLYEISDLLIDTQHFLLLLNDIKLDQTKKYY